MSSPRRTPGHQRPYSHSNTISLAPPPPLPNWSQTPTPGTTIAPVPMPPPAPLGLPERDVFGPRPQSKDGRNRRLPAHGAYEEDSESGEEYDLRDAEPWGSRSQGQQRQPYPQQHQPRGTSPTMAVLSNTFSNLSSMVMPPSSSSSRASPQGRMPTDHELEMEAAREREKSRMEAERVLAMENTQMATADELERQNMEAEVLRLLSPATSNKSPRTAAAPSSPNNNTNNSTNSKQSSPNPSWWTAAKARLTSSPVSKDPSAQTTTTMALGGKDLTPAQQIVQDTRKLRKAAPSSSQQNSPGGGGVLPSIFGGRREASRERAAAVRDGGGAGAGERHWPQSASSKFDDPAFINLANGPGQGGRTSMDDGHQERLPPTTDPYARPRTQSAPQTPQRPPPAQLPGPTTPSYAHRPSPAPSSFPSPSQAPSSPYLSHLPTGALDVPSSLLTLSARLEKLEKWTVAHVRALEERMREVEEYVVGREPGWDECERAVGGLRRGVEEVRREVEALAGSGGEWTVDWRGPAPPHQHAAATIERTVTSIKPAPAPGLLVPAQAGEVEVASVASGRSGRETLTGLADTLTDYSRMFLPPGEGEGEEGLERQTSLAARSVGSTDTDASGSFGLPTHEHDGSSSGKSVDLPVTPTTYPVNVADGLGILDLPSAADDDVVGEKDGVTPKKASRLPRPTGDYVESPLTSPAPSPTRSPQPALEAPPARERERERVSPNGRRRYTSALGGGGLAGRAVGEAGSGWTTVALAGGKENVKVEPAEEGKVREKSLLPTPDTPGTAIFAPVPTPSTTKPAQPNSRPTHTAHAYSLSTAAPAPQFFSTTRPRPRPVSTLPQPLSQQSPAPIQIPPPKRVVGAGLGFVDPLVVRARREGGKGEGERVGERAAKEKVPVGQLVKFFDAAMD